jgi:hypothetical protein
VSRRVRLSLIMFIIGILRRHGHSVPLLRGAMSIQLFGNNT